MEYYLAIDIGASSGRHILGSVENGKIQLEEIYRFDNGINKIENEYCWDIEQLFKEIKTGIKKCKEIGKIPKSIGIDTWAVDFVLLDENDVEIKKIPVRELTDALKKSDNISAVVFDGIITQRLLDIASNKNIKEIIGIKMGNVVKLPASVKVLTKKDIE